ncbi:hypothetical protein M0R45_036470 [Rubus argutus]|uniref:Uncharacterized protein n=1 Tax=Rubus argutus TaxID=59490 RepID=A0AAW1VYZ1_RUBAR
MEDSRSNCFFYEEDSRSCKWRKKVQIDLLGVGGNRDKMRSDTEESQLTTVYQKMRATGFLVQTSLYVGAAPCPQSTATRADADLSVLPTLGVDSTSPSITSPSLCHRRSQGGFATPKFGHPSISSAQTPYPSSPLLCAQPDVAPSPLHPASSAPTPPISGNKPVRTAQYTCTG